MEILRLSNHGVQSVSIIVTHFSEGKFRLLRSLKLTSYIQISDGRQQAKVSLSRKNRAEEVMFDYA